MTLAQTACVCLWWAQCVAEIDWVCKSVSNRLPQPRKKNLNNHGVFQLTRLAWTRIGRSCASPPSYLADKVAWMKEGGLQHSGNTCQLSWVAVTVDGMVLLKSSFSFGWGKVLCQPYTCIVWRQCTRVTFCQSVRSPCWVGCNPVMSIICCFISERKIK